MQNTRTCRSFRKIASAITFEAFETRQMMSANSIKAIDSGGPDYQMVEAQGVLYAISSHASGGGWTQLWSTKGPASSTKMLLDLRKAGSTIASLDDLTATADGRVFFTATGGTGNGRQLFQLNTSKGGYTQITKDEQAFYTDVMAIGNSLYLYDSTHTQIVTLGSKSQTQVVADTQITDWFQAKGQLFYLNSDQGLYRTNGTSAGTYKISGNMTVGSRDVFVSNDHIYFEGFVGNDHSLYRSDGSSPTPTLIAADFSFSSNRSAEIGSYVYFAGSYYNTSPHAAGGQIYRINSITGEITAATALDQREGGGAPDGLGAVGKHLYFTANDGEFVPSQGTTDRELWRYDTITGVTTKITTDETLYPTEIGAGVLSSYYFVAAPTKDDARFGSRRLYRTSPSNDQIELVGGLPSYTNSNGETKELVAEVMAGSGGLFYQARNMDQPGDYDTYFVPTPYSFIDPTTKVLTVSATEAADVLSITVDGDELVMNLNGLEERQDLADFTTIYVSLKAGDDKLTTNASVTRNMSVVGDSGNDSILTGSGNDSILGGAGKNYLYGMAGNDRIRGGGGFDYVEGGEDKDRIYGRGGSDNLHGNNGVDFIYGDDDENGTGNDTLFGESSNDKLYGYGGNDELYGGNQNDSLFGGKGDDKIYGNNGNDTLDGGLGVDTLLGLDGDDRFFAADGFLDVIDGGLGDDQAERDDNESVILLID